MNDDAIVVGAGVLGLAVAFELNRAGHRVTVVSADVAGAVQSAGRSRIFRLAHADRELTDAAADARGLWGEWERLAGRALIDPVGLLLTGDMSDREIHLRRHGGVERMAGRAHPLAVAHDEWCFEPTGGAIQAEDTVRFLQAGSDLALGEVSSAGGVGVTMTDGRRIEADRVFVCAGPATYALLGVDEPPRMRSVRFSFALRRPLERPAPCWIQRDERLCEPFYAVMDGPDHYSIGLSDAYPADRPQAEQIRDAHARILAIVDRVFPGLEPVAERPICCEFTLNPAGAGGAPVHDGWEVLERAGVIGLTGPSLFKFAPLLGRLLAERAGAARGRSRRGSLAGGLRPM
jgi:sarcosine oxidase